MKKKAVFLCAALAVILYANSALAAATAGCAEWKGGWMFNYGGSDNQTVYINTVCDSGLGCPAKSVLSCYVTGIRISDDQEIMLATSNFEKGKWAYYHTYTPSNALEPYDRIAGYNPGLLYFDNVTAPTIGGPSGVPPALGSGLTFGRKLVPGTCNDWLGRWAFTYFNIATTDTTTDTVTDNVTMKHICDDNASCMDNTVWACQATGSRDSDNKSLFVGRKVGGMFYRYSDNTTLTIDNSSAPFSQINEADFFTTTFAADLSVNDDNQTEPSNLISGKKIIKTPPCIDKDGDGYGENCPAGPDCDDNEPGVHDTCGACLLKVVPKKISKLFSFINPISLFVISADKNSGIEFTGKLAIDWGTEAIKDIIRLRIGKRTILGFMLKRPLKLESDNYTVVVTYGDNDTQQCGKIEVK